MKVCPNKVSSGSNTKFKVYLDSTLKQMVVFDAWKA
jgi:hypothetical protein